MINLCVRRLVSCAVIEDDCSGGKVACLHCKSSLHIMGARCDESRLRHLRVYRCYFRKRSRAKNTKRLYDPHCVQSGRIILWLSKPHFSQICEEFASKY